MRKVTKIEVKQLSREERAMLVYREQLKMYKEYFPELTEEQLIEQIQIGERSE